MRLALHRLATDRGVLGIRPRMTRLEDTAYFAGRTRMARISRFGRLMP